MDAQEAIDMSREAIRTCLMVGGPILLVSLIIGLLISLLQAVTQLHDASISFVPKIMALMLAIGLALPWLSGQLLDFSRQAFAEPMAFRPRASEAPSPSAAVRVAHQTRIELPATPTRVTDAEYEEVQEPRRVEPSPNPFQLPSYRYEVVEHPDLEG